MDYRILLDLFFHLSWTGIYIDHNQYNGILSYFSAIVGGAWTHSWFHMGHTGAQWISCHFIWHDLIYTDALLQLCWSFEKVAVFHRNGHAYFDFRVWHRCGCDSTRRYFFVLFGIVYAFEWETFLFFGNYCFAILTKRDPLHGSSICVRIDTVWKIDSILE